MDYNIRDIFDGMMDPYLPIDEHEYSSTEKIMELTLKKIRTKPSDGLGTRRFAAFVFAAVLIIALSLSAYAISSIHQKRQQQLREKYQVQENNITSYVEYPESGMESGVSLVSAISDDRLMRLYFNLSPVSEEVALKAIEAPRIFCSFGETGYLQIASVELDAEEIQSVERETIYDEHMDKYLSIPNREKIAQLQLDKAYDRESQTLTLTCSIRRDELPAEGDVEMTVFYDETSRGLVGSIYGKVSFALPKVQSRELILAQPVDFEIPEISGAGQILGFTVYPISAKIYYDIEEFADIFSKEYDMSGQQYGRLMQWVNPLDELIRQCKFIFSDGTELRLWGGNGIEYIDGLSFDRINWVGSINIDEIVAVEIMGQRIEVVM